MKNLKFTIITFYQFKKNRNLEKLQNLLKDFCSFHKIKGTILLADEGINGTVAGLTKPIKLLELEIQKLGFTRLELKRSFYELMPFNRLKIKIKNEIVTFDGSQLDVENHSGKHVVFNEWNALIEDKKTLVIDVRNNFEVEIGSFERSINPKTKNFSEFKKYVDKNLSENKNMKIAMYCTGGIRCEKTSAYLKHHGFNDVGQLHGGIIDYARQLEKNEKLENKFEGENFVFDERLGERISNKIISKCHQCGRPSDTHINCRNVNCNLLFIQCKTCKKDHEGCCSPDCIKVKNLPEAFNSLNIPNKALQINPKTISNEKENWINEWLNAS